MSTLAANSVALKLGDDPVIEASGSDVSLVLVASKLLNEVKLRADTVPDDEDGNRVVDKDKFTPGIVEKVAFVSIDELTLPVDETLTGNNAVDGSVTLVVVAVVEELNTTVDA